MRRLLDLLSAIQLLKLEYGPLDASLTLHNRICMGSMTAKHWLNLARSIYVSSFPYIVAIQESCMWSKLS